MLGFKKKFINIFETLLSEFHYAIIGTLENRILTLNSHYVISDLHRFLSGLTL